MRFLFIVFLATSCASGKIDYIKPEPMSDISNKKIINKSFNKTWSKLVEKISETAYTINNMNKESGFINIKYSIDTPTTYVDCGRFKGFYKNAKIDDKYEFFGAQSYMDYYVFSKPNDTFRYERSTKLEGITNLYFKRVSKTKTELKVNNKYFLKVFTNIYYMDNNYRWRTRPSNYKVEFSTMNSGQAPSNASALTCSPNGRLEQFFLDMI